jgi:radical SAM superfamily enzyme YgiQ (UPF0313 family)
MKMKILFVLANDRAQAEPGLGLAYIAAYLRDHMDDLDIKIFQHIPKDISLVEEFSPDLIGISSIVIQYNSAFRFANNIKTRMEVPIIIGGPQITCSPELISNVFDVGVVGEGEQTTLELLQLLRSERRFDIAELEKINGLVFYQNDKLILTKSRNLLEPLDRIPKPARNLLNMDYHLKDKYVFGLSYGRGTTIMTSRGCPFKCAFCSASHLWKKVRYNSAERVVDEIKELIGVFKVKLVRIYDALFPADRSRLRKITDLIENEGINKRIEIGLFCRVDLIDDEICRLLRRMGVVYIDFGIESGNQRILDFLKKKITIEQIENAISLCRKYDFQIGGSFMIGSPTETECEMLNTLSFLKKLKLNRFDFYTVVPYPGTPLYKFCLDNGLLKENLNLNSLKQRNVDSSIMLDKQDILEGKQILLTKEVTPERYTEIYDMFMSEKKKFYDYAWTKHFPDDDTDLY